MTIHTYKGSPKTATYKTVQQTSNYTETTRYLLQPAQLSARHTLQVPRAGAKSSAARSRCSRSTQSSTSSSDGYVAISITYSSSTAQPAHVSEELEDIVGAGRQEGPSGSPTTPQLSQKDRISSRASNARCSRRRKNRFIDPSRFACFHHFHLAPWHTIPQ